MRGIGGGRSAAHTDGSVNPGRGEGLESSVLGLGLLDDIANLLDVVLSVLLCLLKLLLVVLLLQHLLDGVISESLPLGVETLGLALEGLESGEDAVGGLLLLTRADAKEGNGLLGLELGGADEGNADDNGEADDADRGQDLSKAEGRGGGGNLNPSNPQAMDPH